MLVKAGDTVALETPLVTLETEKATMDVPSSAAGRGHEAADRQGRARQRGRPRRDGAGRGRRCAGGAREPARRDGRGRTAPAPAPARPAPAAPVIMGARCRHPPRPRGPVGAPLRARARRRSHARHGHRRQGPHQRGRRQGLRQEGADGAGAGRRAARRVAARAGRRLRDVRPGRGQAARAHPEDLGRAAAGSWVNIPHVTQHDEADITELEKLRASLKDRAASRGIKLTPLAFIARACAQVIAQFPHFNASLDASGQNLVFKKYLHLGFAADTPNGLVVPVIRDADRKDVYELARDLGELAGKARAGKLSAAEMQGGCFTISSLGGIGGTAFTPIINAPEVAILGVSRSQQRPVWQDGAVRAAADAAAVAVLRPPRHRRRRSRALRRRAGGGARRAAGPDRGGALSRVVEQRVPDLGEFQDVDVIEVLVKPGDTRRAPRRRSSRSRPTRRRWTCRRPPPASCRS